jgi:hypothetical protein
VQQPLKRLNNTKIKELLIIASVILMPKLTGDIVQS